MSNKIKTLLKKHKEKLLYLIFGVLTTIFSIILYYVLTRFFKLDVYSSSIISWILSVLFAYITNKLYVFNCKKKKILKEMISFYGFRLLSLAFDLLFMYVMVGLFDINDMISKIISNIIVIILNYIFSKMFIFKGGNE